MMNLPNALSALRIVLTPFCVYFLFGRPSGVALSLILFTIAAISDSFDGYVARRYGRTSALGAFLDPLADKVLVIGVLSGFYVRGLLGAWFVLLIIGRDVAMTGLRVLFNYYGHELRTSYVAKWKTFLQFLVLYLLYAGLIVRLYWSASPAAQMLQQFAPWVIAGVAVLTIFSAVDYVWRNRTFLLRVCVRPYQRIVQVIEQAQRGSKPPYYVYCDGLASVGFLGHLVPAPGSVASFITALVVYLAHFIFPGSLIFIIMIGLFFAGLVAVAIVEKVQGEIDPSYIVIDEVVGMMLTLMVVPHDPLWYFVAFLIFRAWDISKFFPVGLTEQSFSGGLGIMMDDVVAGCCSAVVIHLVRCL